MVEEGGIPVKPYCTECGKELDEDKELCESCSERLNEEYERDCRLDSPIRGQAEGINRERNK